MYFPAHRRQACLHESQRLQVEGAGPAATAGMATLHISNMRVPLRREYVRQLNAGVYIYIEYFLYILQKVFYFSNCAITL